jgi:hypothetical protein
MTPECDYKIEPAITQRQLLATADARDRAEFLRLLTQSTDWLHVLAGMVTLCEEVVDGLGKLPLVGTSSRSIGGLRINVTNDAARVAENYRSVWNASADN